MRELVFDTETTGLDPKGGHRIVEIGFVELVDRMPSGVTFQAYYNPEREMPAEVIRVHGLTDAFLADKPLFADRVGELEDFLQDSPLVAHNAGFDFAFLNHELEMLSRAPVCLSRMVDTHKMARRKFPGGAGFSLDGLCKRFGIDQSHRSLHGALLDAELLAQVYIELTGGRQIGLGLDPVPASEPSTIAIAAATSPATPVARRAPRPHTPSAAERAAHAAFCEANDIPAWSA